jgi:hypothetical protein
MTTQSGEPYVTCLLSYVIASADMYYAEMEKRGVFLSCDEHGNFHIVGRSVDGDPSTTIDLFEIFLEYALSCCSWADKEETLFNMQDFGERLSRSLVKQLENNAMLSKSRSSVSYILKYIFETVDAHPVVENIDSGLRFIISDYPLEKAAERSGLRDVELAHHGINCMCQSLVRCINPRLTLSASSDVRSEFIFTILTPTPSFA